VKCPRVIRRWQNVKREVLGECSGGMKVQPAPVKAMSRNLRFSCCRLVHCYFVRAVPMPLRRNPERHRPVRWALENGGISIVPHLISVVFELLPERA
jgi:hypothetical protein